MCVCVCLNLIENCSNQINGFQNKKKLYIYIYVLITVFISHAEKSS